MLEDQYFRKHERVNDDIDLDTLRFPSRMTSPITIQLWIIFIAGARKRLFVTRFISQLFGDTITRLPFENVLALVTDAKARRLLSNYARTDHT